MIDLSRPTVQVVVGFFLVMTLGAVAVALLGGETATVRRVVRAIVPVLIGIVLLVSIASYLDPHDV